MIIGITGKMGSGKDTVGKIIQYLIYMNKEVKNRYYPYDVFIEQLNTVKLDDVSNWQIVKFADALKDIVCILTSCTREQLEDTDFKNSHLPDEWKQDINSNETMTYRELLQKLGTDLLRNQLHEDTWLNALFSKYKPNICSGVTHCALASKFEISCNLCPEYPNWIITDCRFPNETNAVKRRGGIVIRVNRENTTGQGKLNPHTSETALDNAEFDYTIDNYDTIEELIEKVKKILIKEHII